jgi:hypothetical protein
MIRKIKVVVAFILLLKFDRQITQAVNDLMRSVFMYYEYEKYTPKIKEPDMIIFA